MNDTAPVNRLREHVNHKERGPIRHYYTYQDVADVLGVRVESVRRYHCQGKIDINNFSSVVQFVAAQLSGR